jgi:hypothetical protein
MHLRNIHLKPNCSYRAECQRGNVTYDKIAFETDGTGRIKTFSGTYSCNSPEFAGEYDYTKIQNITTGESWSACSSLDDRINI